jgi:CPA1 family monovalent cation:H+ antiporter
MQALDLISILLLLVGVFGWVNLRFLHLPVPVGLLAIGLFASVALTIAAAILPHSPLTQMLEHLMLQVNFSRAVLDFMLSFLMFAAGMSLNLRALDGFRLTAGVLATIGIVISTLIVGLAFYAICGLFGIRLSLAWCFVFGALISPTDPAAMLAAIKTVKLPSDVQALLQGESVFNDGVAIVLFGALLGAAAHGDGVDYMSLTLDIIIEGGGAVLLGLGGSYLALKAIRQIEDYGVETAITIALASGIYALSEHLGLSGPIATALAGIVVGSDGARKVMSDRTQGYVHGFWNLIEEILNAVLFLLIGLEVIVLNFPARYLIPSFFAVLVVLIGRFISVTPPAIALTRSRESIGYWIIPVLSWSGARGGVSIALALGLPSGSERTVILAVTYVVVLFSIFVQSLTMGSMIRRFRLAPRNRL